MSSYKAEVGLENVVSALGSRVSSNGISAMRKKERRDIGGHLAGVPIWIKVSLSPPPGTQAVSRGGAGRKLREHLGPYCITRVIPE